MLCTCSVNVHRMQCVLVNFVQGNYTSYKPITRLCNKQCTRKSFMPMASWIAVTKALSYMYMYIIQVSTLYYHSSNVHI